jgi:type IV secretory pathway TrbD component
MNGVAVPKVPLRRPRPRPPGCRVAPIGRALLASILLLLVGAQPALAQAHIDPTLSGVLDRARNVLVGLLVGIATFQLTIAGLRNVMAAGEPEQIEKAKRGVKAAAIGYGLAALATPLVGLLKWIIGA